MKKVYIVLRDERHGVGRSIWGVFHKRESAERQIACFIAPYIKNEGWTAEYPDPNDKEGFVWLEKEPGKVDYVWIIQEEYLKDLED